MSWLGSTMTAAALVVVATLAPAAASRLDGPRIELPILVEATVCALPAPACPRPDEVIRFVVDGAERQVGFTDLTALQGSVTTGQIFAELRIRPVRLFGPTEELAKLRAGVPLRMRAVLRLGARYVFLESLAPLAEN